MEGTHSTQSPSVIVIDSNIKTREEKHVSLLHVWCHPLMMLTIFSDKKVHCSVLAGRCVHASSCQSGKLVYVLQEQAIRVTVQMNAALGLETTLDSTTKNTVLILYLATIGFHWLEFLSV